jgi:hypothetical protein
MTTTTTNGQVRKTLASQLDRLDSILDGLSDGLNEAVSTAVQGAVELAVRQAVSEAVKETLQAVIAEVLTNPDLLAAFRGVVPAAPPQTSASPPEPPRGLFRRACDGVQAGLGVAAHACGSVLGLAANACGSVLGQAAGVKAVARAGWQLARRFKARLLAACGVGVAAGAVTFWAGPWLGVAAASVAGFFTTLAVQARAGLRRLFCPAPAFP